MTANANEICLRVPLSEQEAWDLAQFLKRIGYAEFRNNAIDDDETHRKLNVAEKVRKNLIENGFNPR